ncbi:MAG: tetratricopeptide repeat protein [Gammaproteobacteria bacterium]
MRRSLFVGLLSLLAAVMGVAVAQQPVTIDAIKALADKGDKKTALELLDKRVAADANDVQARFMKGLLLQEMGNRNEAREVFAEIARLFPKIPEAYNNLAALYAQQGEYEQARRALLSAVANAPDYPTVHVNLGDLYIKMAVDAYRDALALNPGDADAKAKLRFLEKLLGGG